MSIVSTVVLKDDDKTYRQKFLIYDSEDPITLSMADPQLQQMVEDARSNFNGKPDQIVIKIDYIWK